MEDDEEEKEGRTGEGGRVAKANRRSKPMNNFLCGLSVGLFIGWAFGPWTIAQAQAPPDSFDALLAGNNPECISLSQVRATGAKVEILNNNQFQFIRAVWMFIPPISKELPPGDTAWRADKNGKVLLGLVGDGIVEGKASPEAICARFFAPDFVVKEVEEVGKPDGGVGKVGEGL